MGNMDTYVKSPDACPTQVAQVTVLPMAYFGVQFRMARAATRLGVRDVCAGARMSARTLGLIEAADEIEYGVKQEGCFEEGTIEKLIDFYRGHGVTFTTSTAGVPGASYKPKVRR